MRLPKIIIALLIIIAIVPLIYLIGFSPNGIWSDDVMGNWFATMIGAIIGVPIALLLSSIEEKTKRKKLKEETLSMIKEELLENKKRTKEIIADLEEKRTILSPGLSDEYWRSLSSSGQLEWYLENPKLMRSIAKAYLIVNSIRVNEEKCMDGWILFSGIDSDESQDKLDILFGQLRDGYSLYRNYVNKLLDLPEFKKIDVVIGDVNEIIVP